MSDEGIRAAGRQAELGGEEAARALRERLRAGLIDGNMLALAALCVHALARQVVDHSVWITGPRNHKTQAEMASSFDNGDHVSFCEALAFWDYTSFMAAAVLAVRVALPSMENAAHAWECGNCGGRGRHRCGRCGGGCDNGPSCEQCDASGRVPDPRLLALSEALSDWLELPCVNQQRHIGETADITSFSDIGEPDDERHTGYEPVWESIRSVFGEEIVVPAMLAELLQSICCVLDEDYFMEKLGAALSEWATRRPVATEPDAADFVLGYVSEVHETAKEIQESLAETYDAETVRAALWWLIVQFKVTVVDGNYIRPYVRSAESA